MPEFSQRQQWLKDMSIPTVFNPPEETWTKTPSGTLNYVLVPTRNCNLACTYCSQHENVDFSYDELVGVVDTIFSEYPEGMTELDFYGGEPLLRFDVVKSVFAYIESKYANRVEMYCVTTNATLVTDEIAAFFAAHKDRIYILPSLDGNRASDVARVFVDGTQSFDAAIEGINKLFKAGAKVGWVQFVAHPGNVSALLSGVEFLYNLGFRSVRVSIVDGVDIDQAFVDAYIEEMKKISDFALLHSDLRIPHLMHRMTTIHNGPFIMVRGKPVAIRVPNGNYASRLYADVRNPMIVSAYNYIFDYHQSRLVRS
jgi:sulfatase maturation enzyme AslB (radical SAM superfamily)